MRGVVRIGTGAVSKLHCGPSVAAARCSPRRGPRASSSGGAYYSTQGAQVDAFPEESSVLLLTGLVSRFTLWLALRIRPRQKVLRQNW